ncbi:restriction endonuclease subunit S [Mycoplasmopsis felis]|uniref:restriction endonuclease subunit S n=1 Tax=Mycoplasmopsis felis TaxID=33923 RepID=UPI002B001EA5|nr:restriction endonuclease subunit S [Mycoplasmopsis felis]WQQ10630.1 restriction endonuclease subunit S [Mycoplasmopsis felis]
MKKVLVPKVRFKGFSEEWSEEKLEYIAKVTNGKSNTSDNNKWGQYNLYIRSEEIYKSNKYIFDVEGVITVGDGNIGKIFHYVNGKFDLHQRCYLIYEFQNIWPKYFYYYFSQNFYKRAILMSYTATVNSIRMNTITDMDIMFPKELIEQQKIGKLLDQISNLINLENSKLNKLKQLKETLLQKMFPEGNSKTPRIRFKGFDEEWKEEKLDDIFKVITGGEPPKNYKNSKHPVGEYKYPIYSNGQEANAIWGFSDNYSINTEAITISSIGTIGFPVVRKMFFTPIIRLKTLLPYNKNMNINFLNLSVSQINFSFNQAGIPSMNSNQLKDNIILILRNFSEQQKIGDFFSKIDNLISLYHSKLNKLKQIKEALLQKMFV